MQSGTAPVISVSRPSRGGRDRSVERESGTGNSTASFGWNNTRGTEYRPDSTDSSLRYALDIVDAASRGRTPQTGFLCYRATYIAAAPLFGCCAGNSAIASHSSLSREMGCSCPDPESQRRRRELGRDWSLGPLIKLSLLCDIFRGHPSHSSPPASRPAPAAPSCTHHLKPSPGPLRRTWDPILHHPLVIIRVLLP
jgi:hypothetical protein